MERFETKVTWRTILPLSALAAAGLALAAPDSKPETSPIAVLSIEGIIDPVLARYVERGYAEAEEAQAQCVIVEINTPGGLEPSMREIVQAILNSPLPTIGYVSPQGARAASAGAFIVMACHIAAMAPGTTIGAAHPVTGQGKDIEGAMKDKITNDMVAFMRSLAEQRGRDAKWAEDAVRKSVSANEGEALKKGIIDAIARDLGELLEKLDGRKVKVGSATRTLKLAGARKLPIDLSLRERFFHVLAHPELAYILLTLGMLGLVFELKAPHGITGIVGGICLVLALISLSVIPFSMGGLLLILLAVGLFLADLYTSASGVLSIFGVVSLLFGSLMLFSPIEPFWHVSRIVILTMVALTTAFFGTLVWLGFKAQRAKAATGKEILVGVTGETVTVLDAGGGQVHVEGETWSAVLTGPTRNLKKGSKVIVKAVNGLTLEVEPLTNKRSK